MNEHGEQSTNADADIDTLAQPQQGNGLNSSSTTSVSIADDEREYKFALQLYKLSGNEFFNPDSYPKHNPDSSSNNIPPVIKEKKLSPAKSMLQKAVLVAYFLSSLVFVFFLIDVFVVPLFTLALDFTVLGFTIPLVVFACWSLYHLVNELNYFLDLLKKDRLTWLSLIKIVSKALVFFTAFATSLAIGLLAFVAATTQSSVFALSAAALQSIIVGTALFGIPYLAIPVIVFAIIAIVLACCFSKDALVLKFNQKNYISNTPTKYNQFQNDYYVQSCFGKKQELPRFSEIVSRESKIKKVIEYPPDSRYLSDIALEKERKQFSATLNSSVIILEDYSETRTNTPQPSDASTATTLCP